MTTDLVGKARRRVEELAERGVAAVLETQVEWPSRHVLVVVANGTEMTVSVFPAELARDFGISSGSDPGMMDRLLVPIRGRWVLVVTIEGIAALQYLPVVTGGVGVA
jgi:hypothetical protein